MRLTVPIKFKKMYNKTVVPELMTEGAACVDLVATEVEYLDENKVIVKFGFATEIPEGYKIIFQPRSSFTHKSWVMQNSPAQIDSDYRGEWIAKFEAIPIGVSNGVLIYEEFPYKPGDRVVQASVEVAIAMKFNVVKELSTTVRSEGGFGSTDVLK